jgi:copper resistance protein C
MTKVNFRFSLAAMILSFSFLSFNPISAGANTLVSTSPISGSTVSVSPTNVTVTGQLPLLADAVDANVITVKDPNGDRVDDGTISISDLSASVGLKPLIVTGMYRVSYSLLSEADEPLVGEFSFKYLAPSNIAPIEPSPEPTQSQSPASSSWATNVFVILLLFGAVIVTIGLSLYARKLFSER